MKKSISLVLLTLAFVTFSCQSKKTENKEAALPVGVSKIVVKQTFDAGGYSYINGTNDVWVAVGKNSIEVGKTYYYKNALEMRNFHSKELNRDFPLIYFINTISETFIDNDQQIPNAQMKKQTAKKIEVTMEKEEGISSIADIFSNKNEFSGKEVTIKGKVAKFNPNIMGKNWIHIQDGTEFEGNYDLTVTSSEFVSIGQIVEFRGIISLNKDFGAGYVYDVIMENAASQK
ncbi:hypothetical protein [Labilibaculum sp.]|uniref:hypothetical protein n=1 Tax=Labilibaculum sp. TaxID=2060723 RepID=UPI003565BB72